LKLTAALAILFTGGALLLPSTASAQYYQLYTAPVFFWQFANVQDCGPCSHSPGPFENNLTQAWVDAQQDVNICSDGVCWTALDLAGGGTSFDGNAYQNYFGVQECQAGGCNYFPNMGWIQTSYACPVGFGAGYYNYPAGDRLIACAMTISSIQPPPRNCKSCLGDPIYAADGESRQTEVDYAGATGLNYTRTYRSVTGSFASTLSAGFLNLSSSSPPALPGCYFSAYSTANVSGAYCFPYINVYPYANSGAPQYDLLTDDGRTIPFTGPNSAITQSADVNERVTQITFGGASAWQVQREDDSIEIYNSTGQLVQKTLRGGQVFTYAYSGNQLTSQSDAFGHTLSWQYNAAGQMTQMTDPAGGTYQYGYDMNGNLTSVTYPDSTSKSYEYNESANTGGNYLPTALTGITDESATRYATFQYNSAGAAVNTQLAGGVDSYSFTYGYLGYNATVVDPLGTSRTYHFYPTLSYDLDTSQTQPAASGSGTVTQSWSHDANGNISSFTDYNGNVTNYVYDLTRNLETSRTEAYGTSIARTITTTWNSTWRQPALITEPNRTTAFTYDSLGNVLTKTVTDTSVSPNVVRTWTWTYDSYGRMLTSKGPRTDVNGTTTYTYYTCTSGYQCGELDTVTDPVGNVTTYNTYNAHGQPLTITDPNGVVTTLTYDARTRLTSRKVGTETTSFAYYPTGLLETVTLPDASTISHTYDGAHRLTKVTDSAGNYISYTLDAMGNRTAESSYDPSNSLHRTHSRVYNALGELSQDINAANTSAVTTTYGYDDNGNQTGISAPLSRNTANVYDALNRLSAITDPNGGVTNFTYNANDNLATVEDPRSLTTTYTSNGFNEVSALASPDTGSSSNTYDSGGNLSVATDARGSSANYSYDASNRVTSIVYKNSGGVTDQTLTFGYDAGTYGKGRLTSAGDGNHTLSWTYDFAGRVTGKGQTVGTVTLSVGYGYTNGDLTALTTPSGQGVVYSYNSNHQVTGITVNGTSLLTGVTYEPFGGVNGWSWGNGGTVTRTYNGDGLISQIVSASVTNAYSFDNANRITGITDSSSSALSWTYGYDLLDRLTSAATSSNTYGWTYDADGNRLTQTGTSASTFNVSTSSNQLTSTTGALARTYSYNAAGMATAYGSDSFSYNNRGRMSGVSVSGTSTSYLYSALGQLIEKSGSGSELYMYDEAGHLLGEYTSTGTLIQETIWLGDIPVATLQPNGSSISIYYVHTDDLNTPKKVTRPSDNSIMWRWDQDPFGTATPNQNPSGLGTFVYNPRFPGQIYMAETGLNQNYFRDYDPQTGRYLESDLIGLRGGVNTYGYVGADPISFSDPRGLSGPGTDGFDKAFRASCKCPTVPTAPACANIDKNIADARQHFDPNWFYDQVRNHGPWDYKQQGSQYQDFGNFNYGATGSAFGFLDQILLRMAGYAQQQAGTSLPVWNGPLGGPPYGDDPADQVLIQQGIQYFKCRCFK
jgi:RHS repeat-associated protein